MGKFFSSAWARVKSVFHSKELRTAIGLATQASIMFLDNDARRRFVVESLTGRFGFSENTARLLTEVAVKAIKSVKA